MLVKVNAIFVINFTIITTSYCNQYVDFMHFIVPKKSTYLIRLALLQSTKNLITDVC